MNSIDLLEKTDLNWTVRKEKLVTESGLGVTEKVALVREDTNKVLSIMGDGYEMYQNHEAMELLFKISQHTGLNVHRAGYFGEGNKIFIQLKSDDLNLNGDTIQGFITAVNSFDGSTSLAFGNSTLTISCMNTFYKVFKNLDTKIRHTASLRPRIDEILRGIDKLLVEEKNDFQKIKRMSEIEMSPEIQELIVRTLFQLENTDKIGELSTRKDNLINNFMVGWEKEINEKGDNLWGGFSAVTYFNNHLKYKTKEKAEFNKMFAKTGELERNIWHKLTNELVMA